ncbi:hypothetical protein ACI6PS_03470 [Flavobacterium sp. PLA-1-15]|uniref:hypothetical protein n=1 Tax=Flavobacterium sp. PLA-1-15 TaxID=3380533 RepID=UPI003B7874DC
MDEKKILQRINQLEMFAGLIINEATMLKQELSGVVSDNSPQKGKLPASEIAKVLSNRHQKRSKL